VEAALLSLLPGGKRAGYYQFGRLLERAIRKLEINLLSTTLS
jgi:hypothetical protein